MKSQIETQASSAGVRTSVIKSLVSGLETAMKEKPLDDIRVAKERRSHDEERSRRRMSNPGYAKVHIDEIPVPSGSPVVAGMGENKIIEETEGRGESQGKGGDGAGRGEK